ncbi:hypothetical protein FQN49_000878 [Arthroderma sp. PD_2]|nr:hypothetical protein FQN49_000878 [Arthroderma sp. PD_2]
MHVNLLSLLWLFILLPQLGLGDALGIPSPKARVIKTIFECGDRETAIINTALDDSRLAIRATIVRLESLKEVLKKKPTRDDVIKERDRVTWWTFEVIFSQVYWMEEGKEKMNAVGLKFIQKVLDLASEIGSNLEGGDADLDFWCGDSFLTRDYPEDVDEEIRSRDDVFWDNHPEDKGGQRLVRTNSYCNHPKSAPLGYHVDIPRVGKEDLVRIVLCPSLFEHWAKNEFETAASLQELRDITWDRMWIDYLGGTLNPTSLLLHEMSHSAMLGPGSGTKDDAYAWQAVVNLKAPKALNNADSFAYFVVAMYLDKYNWATGFSRALPGDGSGVVDADD